MATYIKGADTYLPDIKPFTPDYKFLSAVLETKTDKYDSNFKATNDLYNKVVYADLSRIDNKDKRDQYAQTIGPAIEKISGMDLSLQQNADQAQSVFAPFYEDNLIVRDIVYTSAYRKEQAMAQRLLDQGTEAAVDRYSARGVKSLQYQMDDFINADPEKAMNMKLPKYVQNANLFKMSEQILGEMEPPLSMKMDQMSDNGDFIITRKNGALVTGAALQVLQQTLMKDPRVQAAYADDAFVASRDFAANAIQNGGYNSVQEGQNAWAAETISRINQRNDINIDKELQEQQRQTQINVNWENYQSSVGIIPGSDMDEALKEQQSIAEATQASLDARMNIRREAGLPTESLDGNLNKAYRMLMQSNIQGDLIAAATSWGARDQEFTIRENKFAVDEKKFKYDMAKIRANAVNARNLQIQKAKDQRDLAIEKGEINVRPENDLANLLKDNRIIYGGANTINGAIDENNKLDPNTDIAERTNSQFLKEDNKIFNEQVEDILSVMQMLNPTGDDANKDQTYGITLADGKEYRGDIESIRKKLTNTDFVPDKENPDALPSYNERENVNNIFDKLSTKFKDTRQVTINDPTLTKGTDKRNQYDALYSKIFDANGTINKQAGLNQFMKTALANQRETYDNTTQTAYKKDGGENDLVLMREAGFPPIMTEQNYKMPYEEYEALVIKGVESGNITNVDLGGWDNGTSNKDYMIDATEWVNYNGQYIKTPIFNEDGSRARVVDEVAVRHDAEEYYQSLSDVFNAGLNSGDLPSGDLYATAYGRSDTRGADVLMFPSYEYTVNPLSINPPGEQELANLLIQINSLDENNTGYGVILGDINSDDVDPSLLIKDPIALKAFELYKKNLNTWMNNDKSSNNDAIVPAGKLAYNPVLGQADDADKTKAGTTFYFGPEWLASKVKGGENNQYGALTIDEVKSLQNGITFVYDQKDDINTKSINNLYYSNVETAILAGNNDYAEFEMPEGLSNTSTYRIIKTGTNDYKIHYSINTYQPKSENWPGGTYSTRTETQPINMDYGMRGLDEYIKNFDFFLRGKREENRLAEEKDNAENAKK